MLGSTTPRLWTPPLVTGPPGPCGCGCALTPATSQGFSAVEFSCDVIGLEPLPWQRWSLIHALELRPDGRFRFRVVLVLVARQNGKTSIVEVKNLWKMFVLRAQVLGTAQNLDLSEESWNNAVEMVEGIPELTAEVRHVDKTNGKKALKLANGARWKVAAASRKGGRGFSGDDVNLDELREHQNWDAWGAVTKTTLARQNPQIWAFSNAGDDKSVVLNDLQAKGRAAVANPDAADPTLGLFEWSVPDDVACTCHRKVPDPHQDDCALADPRLWAMANPSLGYTVTEAALRSALATDPDEVFLTECLCQRVPSMEGGAIDVRQWAKLADPDSQAGVDVVFAFEVAYDRSSSTVAAWSVREDGLGHAEVIDQRPGTDWVVPRLLELRDRWHPVAFGVDGKGPALSLVFNLEEAGIKRPEDPEKPGRGDLSVLTLPDMAAACGQLLDAIAQESFRHLDDPDLNAAVAGAKTRPVGDVEVWGRRNAASEISPLTAVTVARRVYLTRIDAIKPRKRKPSFAFG